MSSPSLIRKKWPDGIGRDSWDMGIDKSMSRKKEVHRKGEWNSKKNQTVLKNTIYILLYLNNNYYWELHELRCRIPRAASVFLFFLL